MTLSTLIAAGRADLLPGYVLSPFPLWAIGEMEDALGRRHVRMAASASQSDPALRSPLIRLAMNDVAAGLYVYGSREFRLASMAVGVAPLLLHLSLRVKHPQITLDQAATLLNESADPYKIVLALWEFLGFSQRPARRVEPKPIDWPAIYHTLLAGVPGKRPAMSRDEIARLTVPQLLHALGIKSTEPRPIAPAQIERRRHQKQDELFDAIARHYGLTPDDLAAKTSEELQRLVREVNGDRPVDAERLPGWARGYAQRRRERTL